MKQKSMSIISLAISLISVSQIIAQTKDEIIASLQLTKRTFTAIEPKEDLFQKSQTPRIWATTLDAITAYTNKYALKDKKLLKAHKAIVDDFNQAVKQVKEGYSVLTSRPFVQKKADAIAGKLTNVSTHMKTVHADLKKATFVLPNKLNVKAVLMAAVQFVQSFADNAFRQLSARELLISQERLPNPHS